MATIGTHGALVRPEFDQRHKVVEYVAEEVRRQGHDTADWDGLRRTAWMLDAWCYALERRNSVPSGRFSGKPSIGDAVAIGRKVEPQKNNLGVRTSGVVVGAQLCPAPERLDEMLAQLWEQRDTLSPLEFYKEFELIHPFVDGNGRTGKILLNWLNHSLLNPVFPPVDLWGRPIRNP